MGGLIEMDWTRWWWVVCVACVLWSCADDTAPPVLLDGFNNDVVNNGTNDGTNDGVGCEAPIEEVCDGLDNDCDGEVDEDFLVQSDINNCGACGRGCEVEHGRAACRQGACAIAGCLEGYFDEDGLVENGCESDACSPSADGVEVCDGRDNDCDGAIDETFGVGSTVAHCLGCGVPCDLEHAEASCNDGVCAVSRCEPGFFDRNGRAVDGCEVTDCQPTSNGQELCDGLDNDCDGDIDEDFDLTTIERCGRCDRVCAYPRGTPACEEGQCVLAACEPGWVDLNRDAALPGSDGCEYLCDPTQPAETDLPCDGQDNDCDGEVDEDGGEGEACALGERLVGIALCSQGALRCVAEPSEGGVAELCGVIEGVLTAEGGPYELVCPELTVPADGRLEVQAGAELRTGLGLQPVRLTVQGELRSALASWRGIEVIVEGEVYLDGDRLEAVVSNQSLLVVPAPGAARLEASSVVLDGRGRQATGLVLGEGTFGEGGLVWEGGALSNLGVGVSTSASAVTLSDVIFTDNRTAARVGAVSGGLRLAGGTLAARNGQPAVGLAVEGEAARVIELDGVTLAMRVADAAVRLDPDALPSVVASDLEVVGGSPSVVLAGSVDAGEVIDVVALGPLDRFRVEGQGVIASGSGLRLAETARLQGEADGGLRVEGVLSAEAGDLLDLAVSVASGGQAELSGARIEASTDHTWSGCLVDGESGANVRLAGARVLGPLRGDGVCLRDVEGEVPLGAATVEGFGRGLVVEGLTRGVIAGVTFVDNRQGLEVRSASLPEITSNTFTSGRAVQTIAMRLVAGARPGGEVVGNTFALDNGDLAYHLDPDVLSDDMGTTLGPNAWTGHRPSSYLMSGELTSPRASIRSVSEDPSEVFVTVQVPSAVEVASGSALNVVVSGAQVLSLQGLTAGDGQTVLRVRGTLTMRGPGVLVSFLPILFEPGSGGTVTQADISSARTDFPLVRIEDAAPRIGGNGTSDGCVFSGSSQGDVIGFELRASGAMCVGGDSLCPFIARNAFYSLGIGMVVYAPASFSGINDFDDANPNGDTVPVNIDRR